MGVPTTCTFFFVLFSFGLFQILLRIQFNSIFVFNFLGKNVINSERLKLNWIEFLLWLFLWMVLIKLNSITRKYVTWSRILFRTQTCSELVLRDSSFRTFTDVPIVLLLVVFIVVDKINFISQNLHENVIPLSMWFI